MAFVDKEQQPVMILPFVWQIEV